MNTKLNKIRGLSLIPILFLGLGISLPLSAHAQSGNIQEADPLPDNVQDNDIVQNQAGDVAATISIQGENIIINYPDGDGNSNNIELNASNISSNASAIGNTITAAAPEGVNLEYSSYQNLSGNVSADNSVVTTGPVPGIVSLTTGAFGNSSQSKNDWGDMNYVATQETQATANVVANSITDTAPDMGNLVVASQASANIAAVDNTHGNVNFDVKQNNSGYVGVSSHDVICCNIYSVNSNALATGNTASNVSNSSTIYNYVDQYNYGDINSVASQYVKNDNTNTSVTAQSAGNSTFAYNVAGYNQLNANQYSNGNITSSAVAETNYFNGSMIVGSAAQANSAVLSTIGSDSGLYISQITGFDGTVSSDTTINGYTEYGVGYATASASGNALVGFACSGCSTTPIGITSAAYQENNANQNATVTANANGSGRVHSYGVAAGNSATFSTQNGQ